MRVKCITAVGVDLTSGKIYEVETRDDERGWYGITDDSGDSYWYDQNLFEVVRENGNAKSGRFCVKS